MRATDYELLKFKAVAINQFDSVLFNNRFTGGKHIFYSESAFNFYYNRHGFIELQDKIFNKKSGIKSWVYFAYERWVPGLQYRNHEKMSVPSY